MGCKGDLTEDRQVSETHAAEFAQSQQATYMECSSRLNERVQEIFTELTRMWIQYHGPFRRQLQQQQHGKDAKQFFRKNNCLLS